MLDTRLNFKHHLAAVNCKAAAVNGALARILPNIGGPQGERRRLISTVTDSIVLYAAPIWAEAKHSHMREVVRPHRRGALRMLFAYRTVSDNAICVIPRKIPVDIHAMELYRLYGVKGVKPTIAEKAVERTRLMVEWQRRWDESTKGRWTYKLTPNLEGWMNRKHGHIDYYLTQILTGHGCFLEYLHRFQLADSPFCPSCSNTVESAEHVPFHCRRFSEERAILAKAFEHPPSHARFVQDMCSTITKWDAAKTFAATVVTRLNRIDWERKAQKRQQQLLLQQQQRQQQKDRLSIQYY